jgi:imidazolonepropionase-like amidohydrolase
MVASMDGASRADGLLELREALDDARAFARNRAGYDKGQAAEYAASRLDLEALQPVLRGELPLVIGANRASDLEALVRFAAEQKVRVIAVGAAEGWMVAPALAAAKIPVVLDPMVYGPGGFDQVHARPDNAKRLADAGVSVVLSSFSSHNARTLSQVAGNAVRGGMDHAAALRAITETPARVFGLGDRGRVEPGAVANLVLWGGDPLELLTPVEAVWIRGRPIALESRQTALQQKYRTMPGTPLPPLAVE